MNTRSIQFRLIAWYTAFAILVAAAFTFYTWHGLKRYLDRDMQAALSRRAGQIEANILTSQNAAGLNAIGPRIEDVYSPEANSRFIRIRRGSETIYASGQPEDRQFDALAVPVTSEARTTYRDARGSGVMLVTRQVVIAGVPGAIDMGVPVAELDSVMRRLLGVLLLALPLTILAMAAGGYVLVRRALRPVTRISRQAETITFADPRRRLPVPHTGDALEQLSLTLNQMLERLDSAYQQASRFSADASHELRTPLAIIRAELESLAGEADAPPFLRDRAGSVLEEVERLSRITESLCSPCPASTRARWASRSAR